jgi:hypothetical protein
MKRSEIVKQTIDDDGSIHFYDQDGDEIFPAVYPVHPTRWRFLWIWIAVFSCVIIWAIRDIRNLTDENKERIAEIQDSRIASCQQTYTILQTLIIQSVPPNTKLTGERLDRYNSFLQLVNPAKCKAQISKSTDDGPTIPPPTLTTNQGG